MSAALMADANFVILSLVDILDRVVNDVWPKVVCGVNECTRRTACRHRQRKPMSAATEDFIETASCVRLLSRNKPDLLGVKDVVSVTLFSLCHSGLYQ